MSTDIPTKPSPPRKPLSPFSLYLQENREQFQKMHPESTNQDITSEISKQFKELPPDQKRHYEEAAAQLKSEYEIEKNDYIKKYGNLPKEYELEEISDDSPQKKAILPYKPLSEYLPKLESQPEGQVSELDIPKEAQEVSEEKNKEPTIEKKELQENESPEAKTADKMIGLDTEPIFSENIAPQEIEEPEQPEPEKPEKTKIIGYTPVPAEGSIGAEEPLLPVEVPVEQTPEAPHEKTEQEQPTEEIVSPAIKGSKPQKKTKTTPSSGKISESTHQALSKAGKKGAAKRWGKKLETTEGGEEVAEPSSSTTKQQKSHKVVDPEISHAFSKIGYMGGKARGGEDSKGVIDLETHEALSKAGKLGAAKRWGKAKENKGVEKEAVHGSHVMTRSQTGHNQYLV